MDNQTKPLGFRQQFCFHTALVGLLAGPVFGQEFNEQFSDFDPEVAMLFAAQVSKRHFIPNEGLPLPGTIVGRLEADPEIVNFEYCIGGIIEIREDLLSGTNETCNSGDDSDDKGLSLEEIEWASALAETGTISVVSGVDQQQFLLRLGQVSEASWSSEVVFPQDTDSRSISFDIEDIPPVSLTVGPTGAEIEASDKFDWIEWLSRRDGSGN